MCTFEYKFCVHQVTNNDKQKKCYYIILLLVHNDINCCQLGSESGNAEFILNF